MTGISRAPGKHYRRAIELNPGHAYTRLYYAIFLSQMGESNWEAEVAAMLRIDPVFSIALCGGGVPYYYARRYEEGIGFQIRCLDAVPDFWVAEMMLSWSYEPREGFPRRLFSPNERSSIPAAATCAWQHWVTAWPEEANARALNRFWPNWSRHQMRCPTHRPTIGL